MEPEKPRYIEKFDIKLKAKPKDGVILQLHHTVKGSRGEYRRIRFCTGAFDDVNGKLACGDNAGNVFILDFIELKFWKLTEVGPSTALQFIPNKNENLIAAGASNYNLNFVNIESGATNFTLSGHTAPVKHISFSNHVKINNLLSASQVEAILWELTNYTKYFTLNTYLAAPIQQIMFSPSGEYLAACFQNDTVQIWKYENMQSVKQIIPSDLKHMKSFAFTMNGRAMAMAGLAPTLILFNMDTWTGVKSIDMSKYKIMGATQIAFIPQLFDGGANKILAILSSDNVLSFFDVESLSIVHSIHPETSGIRKFLVSPNGKYFLCILQLGEVNIYNSSFVIKPENKEVKPNKSDHRCTLPSTEHGVTSLGEIEKKMRVCMDSSRLRRILMEYGEYPDKFRSIIWRSLLDTPRNKSAYTALVEKGIHPAFKDIEKQFTIRSSVTLKNLKRLLSCLAHWSPLFSVLKFLPGFVFPFVKVLQKDPLLLFECVATILFNYCQLWFEYAPFPPISILAIIENLLAQHDPQLLSYYRKIGITSQTYALKILETAFSEVLTSSEWLILWDHILSNEPEFILMAVVSYNMVERNIIKKLKPPEIENFFHMQNPIDKKFFIKNAYSMSNKTSSDIHPKRFLKPFAALDKGSSYPPFTGYPKATICLELAKANRRDYTKNDMDTFLDIASRNIEPRVNSKSIKESDSRLSESDDYDSSNEYTAEKCRRPSHSQHGVVKQESVKTETKKELIESIIHPASVHLHRHKKFGLLSKFRSQRDNEASKHVKSKSKKKCLKKKNGDLEKEVEKLIHSNSDGSGS